MFAVKEQQGTLLEISHEDKEITFMYPGIGRFGTFLELRQNIEQQGARMGTAAEHASLIYEAFQSQNRNARSIVRLVNDEERSLLTNTVVLWTRDRMYVKDNPKIENNSVEMNINYLDSQLQEGDPSVRVVRYDEFHMERESFKLVHIGHGVESPKEFSKNKGLIALVGCEGAQKLSEIAKLYKNNPQLDGPTDRDIARGLPETVHFSGSFGNGVSEFSVGAYRMESHITGPAFGIQE